MRKRPGNYKRKWLLSLQIGLAFLFTLNFLSDPAFANWPPFDFEMEPSHQDGRLTYQMEFSNEAGWPMTDVAFSIRVPEGTRFVEAYAQPTTAIDFDGEEVTFFTAQDVRRSIEDIFLVLEVIDPSITTVTTQAWISWKGEQPGGYLTEPMTVDLTKQRLDWKKPKYRLQLEAAADVVNDVITYSFYPTYTDRYRMWDLKINIPVPEGTSFLSAEAPPPFEANFDGQEVSFFILEMPEDVEPGPLRFRVSTEGDQGSPAVTHAWATWKNGGRKLKQGIPAVESYRTGDIIVQPGKRQQLLTDTVGDVPLSDYDLTAVAVGEDGNQLEALFYTVQEVGPEGRPLEFTFYLDQDCQIETGSKRGNLGVEYRVRYRHDRNQVDTHTWNSTEAKWRRFRLSEGVSADVTGNRVALPIPAEFFDFDQQFCWAGDAKSRPEEISPRPPTDRVPNGARFRPGFYNKVSAEQSGPQ